MKQMSLGTNLFELSPKRTRKRQCLEEMDAVVPWTRLIELIEPHYAKGDVGPPRAAQWVRSTEWKSLADSGGWTYGGGGGKPWFPTIQWVIES